MLDLFQKIPQLLTHFGLTDYYADYIGLFINSILVLIIAYLLRILCRTGLLYITEYVSDKTAFQFDDFLVKNRFFRNTARIAPLYFLYKIAPYLLYNHETLQVIYLKILNITTIFVVIFILTSLLKAFKDQLKEIDRYKDKPIDSYIQVVAIIIWLFGFFSIILTLFDVDMRAILASFGAVSAIVILIFKDTILGFVASLQVSANDLVRIGDWITLEKYGADGFVNEINLATVKVRNFDNTITTIPTYSLISDSFVNWRGMFDSGGRRIKRHIFIKENSIRFVKDEELDYYKKISLITNYIEHRQRDILKFNQRNNVDKSLLINGRNLTNFGLFRKYITEYLEKQQVLNHDLMLIVRHLQPTEKGIPLEIYAFSKDKVWKNYEHIVGDIFDHILASVKYFDLEIFELPSSSDFKAFVDYQNKKGEL
ncbi:mechanosensitive ion channel family protein [Flavobacterium agricola]|uniref:Mechanosensitive ion channel family protein n=1 Tax=Flavobacterium agricola TaxID=2870839 RepID=A0ABY6M0R0_9FLAO|nr:mechanosensitive ion channel family protein [Flavobacterium agricola]UYW02133.1 mechanosensitive ion channel family protein [Flavobacterium agricola]